MKKVVALFCLMLVSLTSITGLALPTTAQKINCATLKLNQELDRNGYILSQDSLDLKGSKNPINLLYIGADIASLLAGRGFNGSDVEYITFKAMRKDRVETISGWMYVLSFVNTTNREMHDCTVGDTGSKSSISLGSLVLE